MKFILNSKVILSGIGYAAEQHIKNSLTMDNPKFKYLEKMGRYTGNITQKISFYDSTDQGLVVPRGFAARAYHICKEHGEEVDPIDNRLVFDPVPFTFNGKLKPFQAEAVEVIQRYESGVLSSTTGSGKTVMGLYIIAERKQPTLIIVHTKELLNQWIDRIEQFLGIPADEMGVIGAGSPWGTGSLSAWCRLFASELMRSRIA
ncbi:MAG: DEAD/DEAH box helicase family protein [Desulfobacterium sp.]|nr:DEAD/DEAH box helicase family protein [Desulfobacterium sp.]